MEYRRRMSRNSGRVTAHGFDLPPLYPWAPDLPKKPVAIRPRPNSAQAMVPNVNGHTRNTPQGSVVNGHPPSPTNSHVNGGSSSKISSFNGHSTGSSTTSELPAESTFIPVSPTGPAVNGEVNILPEKYFISSPRDQLPKRSSVGAPHTNTSSSTPVVAPIIGPPSPQTTQNAKQKAATSTSSHGYGIQTRGMRAASPRATPVKRPVTAETGTQTEGGAEAGVSLLTICKEMVRLTARRAKSMTEGLEEGEEEESLADRILISCESIKVAVINILEGYTQSKEAGEGGSTFAESDLVRITSIQLVTSLELLVSQTSLWLATYSDSGHDMIQETNENIGKNVKGLAEELLAFIQACESNTDSVAHGSSARILSLLYELVRHCGELAIATDARPTSLHDPGPDSGRNREEDIVHILPSSDLKQAFLSGADSLVDHTLDEAMYAVEGCEKTAEQLTAGQFMYENEGLVDVLKHVYIVIATSKLLVYKCREIQVELDTDMQEDCLRPENYYLCYFRRCQAVMRHASTLIDNLRLLLQAAQPLVNESDPGVLKKLCRCSEIVQRTSSRLIKSSVSELSASPTSGHSGLPYNLSLDISVSSSAHNMSLDTPSLLSQDSEMSILSSDQMSQLGSAGDDVYVATKVLIDLARRELTLVGGHEVKVRRMLPATPSNIRPTVRPKSARSIERRSLNESLSQRDLDTSGTLTSARYS